MPVSAVPFVHYERILLGACSVVTGGVRAPLRWWEDGKAPAPRGSEDAHYWTLKQV